MVRTTKGRSRFLRSKPTHHGFEVAWFLRNPQEELPSRRLVLLDRAFSEFSFSLAGLSTAPTPTRKRRSPSKKEALLSLPVPKRFERVVERSDANLGVSGLAALR